MNYPPKNSLNNNLVPQNFQLSSEDMAVFKKVFERDISKNTKKAIHGDLKHFITWYHSMNKEVFTFRRLISRDVLDYKRYCVEHLKHSVSTVNRRLIHIRLLCKNALKMGHFKNDPTANIKTLALQPLAPKGLTEKELRSLLKEVEIRGNLRDRLIIEILIGTGLRVSEIAALTINDIFISERKGHAIVRGKGNKMRSVPLNSKIRELLVMYQEKHKPTEKLFYGQRGSLTIFAYAKILDFYAKKAGIKCHLHQLRHTFSFLFLKQNPQEIVALSQILGHSNLNTTRIYTQNSLSDLQEKTENLFY